MIKIKPINLVIQLVGHRIRIAVSEISNPKATDHVNEYCFDRDSLQTVLEDMDHEAYEGEFTIQTYFVLADYEPESLVTLKGTWQIIPDYAAWIRVYRWSYNKASSQSPTQEDFTQTFGGALGNHFYEKWVYHAQYSVEKMMMYFGNDIGLGTKFLSLIMSYVIQYEKELAAYRNQYMLKIKPRKSCS